MAIKKKATKKTAIKKVAKKKPSAKQIEARKKFTAMVKAKAAAKKSKPKRKTAIKKVAIKKATPKRKTATKKVAPKQVRRKKSTIQKTEYSFFDSLIQAKKPGRRVSATGKVYYENRHNRSDKKKWL